MTRRLLVLLLAAGCVAEEDVGSDEGALIVPQISVETVNGDPTQTLPGVVQLAIPGDPRVRTGFLLTPDLVVTAKRWLPANVTPSAIAVRHGTAIRNGQVRQGWLVTTNPNLPYAVLQVAQPFTGATPVTLDTRPLAQIDWPALTEMYCYAYAHRDAFGFSFMYVGESLGTIEAIVDRGWTPFDDADAGAPCFDRGTGRFMGMLTRSSAPDPDREASWSEMVVASETYGFLDGMRRVARIRREGNQGRGYLVQNGTGCLDVPGANFADAVPLQRYACHGGDNQRWYLDWSHPGGPSLVNAQTGTCVDVPGGQQTGGLRLQTQRCHDGANQGLTWNGSDGSLSPLSAPLAGGRRTLCLTARPGSGTVGVEQAGCAVGAAAQQWGFAQ